MVTANEIALPTYVWGEVKFWDISPLQLQAPDDHTQQHKNCLVTNNAQPNFLTPSPNINARFTANPFLTPLTKINAPF